MYLSKSVRRLAPSAVIGVITGSVLLAGTAWAANVDNLVPFGPPGAIEPAVIERTDNRNVYYYFDSHGDYRLESRDRRVVNRMLDSQYRPTDLAFRYDATPKFSGSGETDTIWQEGRVSGSAEGRAWCNDPYGYFRCDQHYIRIEGGGTITQGLSCHEMGHAVGLTHGRDAYPSVSQRATFLRCMRTPVGSGDVLGSHNRGQINANY